MSKCGVVKKSEREAALMNFVELMIKATNGQRSFECFKTAFCNLLLLECPDIPLIHLFQFNKLLLNLFKKTVEDEAFKAYLLAFMEYLAKPLRVDKISQLTIYADDVTEFYNICAYIFSNTRSIDITRRLLGNLAIYAKIIHTWGDVKPSMIVSCYVRSKFPEVFSNLLQTVEFDLYLEYLRAMELMLATVEECQALIKHNVVNTILIRLSPKWKEYIDDPEIEGEDLTIPYHLNLSQRVLWILIIAYYNSPPDFKNNSFLLITKLAWRSIRSTFIKIVKNKKQRKNRNLFYLLCRVIAGVIPFDIHGQVLFDFHNLIFTTELPHIEKSGWTSDIVFYPDEIDFEFKVSLMSNLCLKQVYPQSYEYLRAINAIPALLIILDENIQLVWTPSQRQYLIYYALIALQNIVSLDLKIFLDEKGPKRLTDTLIKAINDLPAKVNLLFHVVYTICKSLVPNVDYFEEIVMEYKETELIDLLLTLISNFLSSPKLNKTMQYCISLTYSIFTKLLKMLNRFGILATITRTTLQLLNKLVYVKFTSSFLHPNTLIAIMNYIWEVSSYEDLIKNDGIFVILDIIEKFPLAIKIFGLSIIVDFCEISDYLSCMLTWRSKKGENLVPFLMRIYREQCEFDRRNYNTEYLIEDSNPFIRNTTNFKFKLHHANKSSLVLYENLLNCKPKIAALIHLLNCSEQRGLIDESYRISTNKLSYDDKITFTSAEHYYRLKFGEAWNEVHEYIKSEGIRPLVWDQLIIACRIKEYQRCLDHINHKQNIDKKQKENAEINSEYMFYNRLKEQQLSESLDSLQELRQTAYLTKKQFRLKEYDRMMKHLKESRPAREPNFHKTLPVGSHLCVYGQHIDIRSDIVINLNEEKPPKPISPSTVVLENLDIASELCDSDNFEIWTLSSAHGPARSIEGHEN